MINKLTAKAFKENERDSLNFITSYGFFAKIFPELSEQIKLSYHFYRGVNFAHKDFEFTWMFSCPVERQEKKMILGGHVKGDFDEKSYYLAVCKAFALDNECTIEEAREYNLIRKFHFDYANPKHLTKQPVPIHHLQYGGKLYDTIRDKSVGDNNMESWLSIPRLNFSPVNLVLMLDIFLCEFRDGSIEVNQVIEDPHWCGLVKRNEELLSAHYYKRISDFLDSKKHSANLLIRDLLYGARY